MTRYIQLEEKAILHVPVQNYKHDFTFVINEQEFHTNRLVADLLSPKISKYHLIDPTFDEYSIKTRYEGDFSIILDLVEFKKREINPDNLPFILEILENLENTTEFITFYSDKTKQQDNNKTTSEQSLQEIISNLSIHHEFIQFYKDEIKEETQTISKNFYKLSSEDKNKIKAFDINIIEQIIGSNELVLESEDDLIEFINELYLKDHTKSELYSYVEFNQITCNKMKEFVYHFSCDDFTRPIWNSISNRLVQEINRSNEQNKQKRYKQKNKIISYSNKPFDGIINHFNKESMIKEEINLTYSSKNSHNSNSDPWSIFIFDGDKRHFFTDDKENSWICIEFKKHKIRPTHYSIRSGYDDYNLKSFVLEGSNDKKEWVILDKQNEIEYLKNSLSQHTFSISNDTNKSFKYLQIRNTGKNWHGCSHLQINSIEVFGEIF